MNNRNCISSLMAAASISAMLLSGCQGTAVDNQSKETADSAKNIKAEEPDSLIAEFPLRESIMTASQSYKIVSDDDPALIWYVTINTSVQWPETIGKYKITNLQDSLIDITFGAKANKDIKKAIRNSITDLEAYGLTGKTTVIDTVPKSDSPGEFYVTRSLQLIECTQQTVTYSATYSDFLGGAHPNSSATPFSFVLETDQPVTMEYLFTKDSFKKIIPYVMQSIADSHSMTLDELKSAMFNSLENVRTNVYILNGNIAFHYNPYDILPYSFGPSEAYISPIEVEEYLTPAGKKLLLE